MGVLDSHQRRNDENGKSDFSIEFLKPHTEFHVTVNKLVSSRTLDTVSMRRIDSMI